MKRCYILLACCAAGPAPLAAQAPAEIAVKAKAAFSAHCKRCHPGEGGDAFQVLEIASMTGQREQGEKPYLTPKSPDKSYLWDRIADGSMPKKKSPEREAFTDAAKESIRKWIEAGCPPFPDEPKRDFIPLETVLKAMQDDLLKADQQSRPYLRYFTLTHLHNNAKITADHLRLTRAALSKSLNSLSWQPRIEVPRSIDKEGTILAVDIRRLGWDASLYRELVRAYPYGLAYDNLDNRLLKGIDEDMRRLIDQREELVHLRADWFVATATQPALYNRLLYDKVIPEVRDRRDDPKQPANPKHMTALDLERYLKVDVIADILAGFPNVARAGFPRSGVSGQNRMIERHALKGSGAYWKSYDFKASTWEGNLQQFPLGPRFDRNPNAKQAFVHDGGEIVFSLPNGLQGYFLINGKDERIDAGPIEVVSDALKTSGTAAIVSGLSCIACHTHGMKDSPKDTVRNGSGVGGRLKDRVRELYVDDAEMKKLLQKDSRIFTAALDEAVGPFLKVGDNAGKKVEDLTEPVGEVARKYLIEDLDLEAVAAELFVDRPEELKERIRASAEARELGLGALLEKDGFIKRGAWEAVRGSSQMQLAARRLYQYSAVRILD